MLKKIISIILAAVTVFTVPVSACALSVKELEDIYRTGVEWQEQWNQTYINWLLESDNFLYHLDVTQDDFITSTQYASLNLDYSERKENFEEILTSFIGLSYETVKKQASKEVYQELSVEFLEQFQNAVSTSENLTQKQINQIHKAIKSTSEYYIMNNFDGVSDSVKYEYDSVYDKIKEYLADSSFDSKLKAEFNLFKKSDDWLTAVEGISDTYSALDKTIDILKKGYGVIGEIESYNRADEKYVELLDNIMSNTWDDALYDACYDIKEKLDYNYTQHIVDGVKEIARDLVGEWVMDSVKDLVAKNCGIYAVFAKIGISAGEAVSDIWFNTSEIKNHCQTMYCLNEISEIVSASVSYDIDETPYFYESEYYANRASQLIYNMSVLVKLREMGEESYYNLKNSAYDAAVINACQTLGWGSFSQDEEIIEAWYSQFGSALETVRSSLFRIIPPQYYYGFGVTLAKDLEYTIENNEVTVTGFCGNYTLKELVIPSLIEGYPVTKIGNYAFEHHYSLVSVMIPDGVVEICEGAFSRCISLSKIYIPDSVVKMGCWVLENTVIENNEENWVDGALYVGKHLLGIDYSDSSSFVVKEGTKSISDYVFQGRMFESITLPEGLAGIGKGAFDEALILKTVNIPDTVEYIGDGAFNRCGNLEEIVLPDGITEIGKSLFNRCCSLRKVIIPSGVKSIGSYAFNCCCALKTIKIPNTVETIGEYAFNDCSSLTSVTIPVSIKTIGEKAFGYYTDWDNGCVPAKYKNFVIKGTYNSAAQKYAEDNGFKFVDANHKHTSSGWKVVKKATVYSAGKKQKECTICGDVLKTAKIPQLKCSKPTLKKIENVSDGVQITWGKVKGADSYKVYRKVKGGSYKYIGKTTELSYIDTSAKSSKTYYYVVKAINEAGASANSKALSKKYLKAPYVFSDKKDSGIELYWEKVSGAEYYKVYRSVGNGSFKYIGKTKKNIFVDKNVKKGNLYKYRVKAFSGKVSSAYNAWGCSVATIDTPNATLKSTKNGVKITWKRVPECDGYAITRTDSNGNMVCLMETDKNTVLKYTDKTAKKGKTYTYCVMAKLEPEGYYVGTNVDIKVKY